MSNGRSFFTEVLLFIKFMNDNVTALTNFIVNLSIPALYLEQQL
ncbi:hypothetical protein N0O92_11205 [Alkalihalobacillus sp. MEB130]|nr:hypothetical protein [Alkalihalobacillus sp. MEB130]MDT8860803.1 hypothetical protein [Alkalihalobacillus sp. MEB130]